MPGETWSYEEREALRRMAEQKAAIAEIAQRLGRSYDAIRNQAKRLRIELPGG